MLASTNSVRVAAPVRARASRGFRCATTATARVDKCDKKKVMVSPSILSANFAKLGEQVRGDDASRPAALHAGTAARAAPPGAIKRTNPIGHELGRASPGGGRRRRRR